VDGGGEEESTRNVWPIQMMSLVSPFAALSAATVIP
jgi:hypothetical protein